MKRVDRYFKRLLQECDYDMKNHTYQMHVSKLINKFPCYFALVHILTPQITIYTDYLLSYDYKLQSTRFLLKNQNWRVLLLLFRILNPYNITFKKQFINHEIIKIEI